MEIQPDDVGYYQCVVDNAGNPIMEDHLVTLAGETKGCPIIRDPIVDCWINQYKYRVIYYGTF